DTDARARQDTLKSGDDRFFLWVGLQAGWRAHILRIDAVIWVRVYPRPNDACHGDQQQHDRAGNCRTVPLEPDPRVLPERATRDGPVTLCCCNLVSHSAPVDQATH